MSNLTTISDTRVLRNGVEIPCMGFDTRTIAPEDTTTAVIEALKSGFRMLITAEYANNAEELADIIAHGPVKREDLFIVSCADIDLRGYHNTRTIIKSSLQHLGVESIDLYLVHLPQIKYVDGKISETTRDTWKALEDAYQDGEVRAIGVCSLAETQLKPLLPAVDVLPMVDHIELHPRCNEPATLTFCANNDIIPLGWMPFGDGSILNNGALIDLSLKYSCTPEQICLRWALQRHAIPLPTSTDPGEISLFAEVFGFALNEHDMAIIDFMDPYGDSGLTKVTHDN